MTTVTPVVHVLDREQGRQLLDKAARRYLDMSGDDFLSAYDAGALDPDDFAVVQVAILIPFAR